MGDKEAVEEGTTNGGGDLNPNAKEWSPIHDSAPEEDRCLFLTFSNGYPLTEHQIVHFFTRYARTHACPVFLSVCVCVFVLCY